MKKGWEYKKLGEVCEIYQPTTIATSQLIPNGKYLVYGANGIIGRYNEYNHEEAEVLLCCRGATCGAINLSQPKSWVNGNAMVVKPKTNEIIKNFLIYLLTSLDYTHIITGAAQPQITRKSLFPVSIGLPPLSEQKEIVEYLDSSFAKIDKLKENAAKNLEEAKALFQSALKDALEPKEGWEEKTIQNVCEILNGFAFPSASFMNKGCLKVIKITNVGVGEFIEDNSRLSIEHQDNSAKVNENDIVIALTRTIIADGLKKARVPFSYDGALLNQRVAALTPKKNVVENSFVYYYLGTAQVSKYVLSKVNTLMQPNLSIGDLKKMPIPLPSLQEQQSIVSFLDSLSEKVNTLQQNYSRICDECDALKQAILRQVFE